MGKVLAVCIGEGVGEKKTNIGRAMFEVNHGMVNDAHAGPGHRQVSLLNAEKLDAFNALGANAPYGTFGENLVVQNLDFAAMPVGTLLRCGEVLLQITQIGKNCRKACKMLETVGECIVPRQGVFARVLSGGKIAVGDEMKMEQRMEVRPWQAAVITLSDKGSRGEREDISGPTIVNRLKNNGYEVVQYILIPDEEEELKQHLIRLADQRQLDLILTTGGTGFSPRDRTPQATLSVATRLVPGIAQAVRAASMKITPHAMLSRAQSVIRNKTLIINLPGSPKACMESMDVFMNAIPHAMGLLRNEVQDCARKD